MSRLKGVRNSCNAMNKMILFEPLYLPQLSQTIPLMHDTVYLFTSKSYEYTNDHHNNIKTEQQ